MPKVTVYDWRTVKQAAKRANVCDWTIHRACESRQLRHVRLGGRRSIRLTDEAVDEWLLRFERPSADVAPTSTTTSARR